MDEIIKSIKGDIMSIGVKSEFLHDVVLPSNHWLVQQVKPIVGRYLDEMSRHYFDYWNEPSHIGSSGKVQFSRWIHKIQCRLSLIEICKSSKIGSFCVYKGTTTQSAAMIMLIVF